MAISHLDLVLSSSYEWPAITVDLAIFTNRSPTLACCKKQQGGGNDKSNPSVVIHCHVVDTRLLPGAQTFVE